MDDKLIELAEFNPKITNYIFWFVALVLFISIVGIPILIFSTMAIDAAAYGQSYLGLLALLGAMLVTSITLAPFAIAASLRVSVS